MRKTGSQFEEDVYKQILLSNLANSISGKVYRSGMRPNNSLLEDCVITFKTGTNGQIQDGIVVINTFIPDIMVGTTKVKNISRCKAVEVLADEFAGQLRISGYRFEYNDVIQTIRLQESVQGYEQHFVNLELYFEYVTF